MYYLSELEGQFSMTSQCVVSLKAREGICCYVVSNVLQVFVPEKCLCLIKYTILLTPNFTDQSRFV